jgi:hypothetical protein
MGYASTVPVAFFEFPGNVIGQYLSITDTPTTIDCKTLSWASWAVGRIRYAYLDLIIPYMTNTSPNTNWIDAAQVIQVSYDGGIHWTTAIQINQNTFYLAGNDSYYGTFHHYGTYELVDATTKMINSTDTITIRWVSAASHVNGYMLRSPFFILKAWVE